MYSITWDYINSSSSEGYYTYQIQAGSAWEAIAKFYRTRPEGYIKWITKG